MSAWQPIGNIPEAFKDGRRVQVGWWFADEWQQRTAWWDAQFDAEYDGDYMDYIYHGAWTDHAVKDFGMEECHSYEPTHWMPLPEPPEVA